MTATVLRVVRAVLVLLCVGSYAIPLGDNHRFEICNSSPDRGLCESTTCSGFEWCFLCDKCVQLKDEL